MRDQHSNIVITIPGSVALASAAPQRLVGFQAAASTLGAVTFSSLVGLIMGADVTGFAYCVVALVRLTAAASGY